MDTWEIKAIKITELNSMMTPEERELILTSTCREVSLQRKLKHPHVCLNLFAAKKPNHIKLLSIITELDKIVVAIYVFKL